jgi:hypothetical protein
MKSDFVEDFASHKAAPGAHTADEFPFAEVDRLLGEVATDLPERDYDALGHAIVSVLTFICARRDSLSQSDQVRFGRRAVALLWVIKPEAFSGKSLTKIAAELGITSARLAPFSGEVTTTFGVRNGGQAHGWNRGRKGVKSCHYLTKMPAPACLADNKPGRWWLAECSGGEQPPGGTGGQRQRGRQQQLDQQHQPERITHSGADAPAQGEINGKQNRDEHARLPQHRPREMERVFA